MLPVKHHGEQKLKLITVLVVGTRWDEKKKKMGAGEARTNTSSLPCSHSVLSAPD
jgi:hypothetical protein